MAVERIELGKKDTSGAGCACCAAPETATTATTSAQVGETEVIRVEGMTCGHCVSAVTQELSAVGGVEGVDVDLVAGGVSTVTIRHSEPLSPDAVDAAVSEAGYSVVR
ncbi:heavy-metal-associated domain-containing protein [Microbacterium sp. Marseille-Q6965]|uniref:heavy-metal-associated domain-containing protein n=1 Tax=Microbacterium sp. Marseille-Q6965 TaxID=2965072 RepID=UPI0021B725BC|nr:heavy-metal-associated domain-containing protein [Microbacterium sp. Marseille-Q6965]